MPHGPTASDKKVTLGAPSELLRGVMHGVQLEIARVVDNHNVALERMRIWSRWRDVSEGRDRGRESLS